MYYNTIRRSCFKYMSFYGFSSSVIIMSSSFYDQLEKEMIGKQWLALIKQNSVLGNKIIIDNNLNHDISFVLTDSKNNHELIFYKKDLK